MVEQVYGPREKCLIQFQTTGSWSSNPLMLDSMNDQKVLSYEESMLDVDRKTHMHSSTHHVV